MAKFDIIGFGETMLRLSVPSGIRLSKLKQLDVQVGGAETNVLSALSGLGRRCRWISGLPANDLGNLVRRELTAAGIDTDAVIQTGERVGTYYVEFAAPPRPIKVIYDRAHSAVSQLTPDMLNWDQLLDTQVLHLTGITPALSQGCYDIVLEATQRAQAAGVTVSFDVNYRSKLWSPAEARKRLTPIIRQVNLLICGEGDADTVFGLNGSPADVIQGLSDLSGAEHLILTRSSQGSCTVFEGELIQIAARPAEIVDRLGAGDAFSAGVIDGYLDGDLVDGMRRGSVLSALALTEHGDMITTSRAELDSLMADPTVGIKR